MVDAVVQFVVEKTGDYLIKEAALLSGVKDGVDSLKKELAWMYCFIKDAEEKQVDNPLIKQWVSDIREIAYDFEDVLDEFKLQVGNKDEGESSERKHGHFTAIKKWVAKSSRRGMEKVTTYNIGKKIESLKKELSDVSRRRELYGLRDINIKRDEDSHAVRRMKQLRRTTSFCLEEKVVGYEDETNKLLAKLLDNEPRRYVISIWGTGGLGKTTLAGKLYKSSAIKENFPSCAWVSVSQHFQLEDLLRKIIKSFGRKIIKSFGREIIESFGFSVKELERMSEEDLERHVHKYLQGRKYLVVIDDVWNKEAWASLKRAFPDNENGSRVIITTRSKDVAERSDERTYVHELRFLNSDESWQLFCDKAFWNSSAEDKGLEKLGREMVEKCRGLPLAIVVLGGLLATKKPHQWNSVRKNIWKKLSDDSIHITNLLALSFGDLPYQLKLCFLYLSQFPEDDVIYTEQQLIYPWVAEGFIPHNEEIMEDVARNYLNELINRSLIQKGETLLGKVVTCRIHDLLRDLTIKKAKELNFIRTFDGIRNSSTHSSTQSCRRLAIYSGMKGTMCLRQCTPVLRSLLLSDFIEEDLTPQEFVSTLCKKFRFLRVLEFDGLPREFDFSLPKNIDKLVHLKYLGLRRTCIKGIPKSILNMSNLETLVLHDHKGGEVSLPTEICKLKNLRHLMGNFTRQYLRIDNMTNLQTLAYVNGETLTKSNPETLVNLRELHVSLKYERKSNFTFDPIASLKSIQILWVALSDHQFFSALQPLSGCLHLRDLELTGKIEKLPEDMHLLLPNVERLVLDNTKLVDDPMPVLEKMLNLAILWLRRDCYLGKKMVCTANSFPRVEILTIDCQLEEWQIEEGALPVLKSLDLAWYQQQYQLPERLKQKLVRQ